LYIIAGHPQIAGFITHGGLLGIQEAVFHAVPMIAFPLFAEQDYNAQRLESTGRGLKLEIGSFTSLDLQDAIRKISSDPSFKKNMALVSKRFRDRPQKPVDTALWWIEYVLRNENTQEYMKPLSAEQYWFQKRLLDVWLVIGIFLILELYILKLLLVWCVKKCCGKSQKVNRLNVKRKIKRT